jgi:hypothetical protein
MHDSLRNQTFIRTYLVPINSLSAPGDSRSFIAYGLNEGCLILPNLNDSSNKRAQTLITCHGGVQNLLALMTTSRFKSKLSFFEKGTKEWLNQAEYTLGNDKETYEMVTILFREFFLQK